MIIPLTNSHIHVFDAECAPGNFLRVIPSKFVRKYPKSIKWLLERKPMRKTIWWLDGKVNGKTRKKRKKLAKYISFLNMATQTSQIEIFSKALEIAKIHDSSARLVGLTLDMDYMDDNRAPDKKFCTQLSEVKQIKKYFPDHFFPFVSVDPRARSGNILLNWIKKYFEYGLISKTSGKAYPYFSGIKIYPALGFFPFDPGLDEIYQYAEANGIPVMYHCTRVGSLYVGRNIESLIPAKPKMIMPGKDSPKYPDALHAQQEIYERINRYYGEKVWIKNSNTGNNDLACDLFSHPQNYVPLMCKYPKLKICLAHMGGDDEIEYMKAEDRKKSSGDEDREKIWEVDGYNWAELIRDLMKKHDSLYTDISFSLSDLDNSKVAANINEWLEAKDDKGEKLGKRILFGTDFYMTEQQKGEAELYTLAKKHLGEWFDKISRENSSRYLY